MNDEFNIQINKKNTNSRLTHDDISSLKQKINDLNTFFNKIFDILCDGKKNLSTKKTVGDVVKLIMTDDIYNTTRTNLTTNLFQKMFNKEQLIKIITDLVTKYNTNNSFIHFVCKYNKDSKTYDDNNRQAKISVGGNPEGNSYINLRDILMESTKEETEIMCIQINDKQKCYHNKSTTSSKCDFCDKWQTDRELFKQLINEMLEQKQIINIIELMKDNLHLFPAAILDQDRYHFFHTSLEEYKKRLR